MPSCYKCGEPFLEDNLAMDAVCPRCSSWLHSCTNCLQYDEYSNQKCREPRAPFIYDRHGKNECPFFRVRKVIREDREKKLSPRAEQKDREGKAREGLERLFKS
jgi:hypothetical protein